MLKVPHLNPFCSHGVYVAQINHDEEKRSLFDTKGNTEPSPNFKSTLKSCQNKFPDILTENCFSEKREEKLRSEDTFLFYSKAHFNIFRHLFPPSTGYSASALLAIIFAIPFGIRLLFHHDGGRWYHFSEAFYIAYFELYLGNACIGEKLLNYHIN